MSLFDQIGQKNMQDQLRQLQQNPTVMLRQAGLNVPEGMGNNPQAMVMHLIQSGQVGGPALQRVMPMIQHMTGKR